MIRKPPLRLTGLPLLDFLTLDDLPKANSTIHSYFSLNVCVNPYVDLTFFLKESSKNR